MRFLLPILCVLVFTTYCNASVIGLWYWTWSSGVKESNTNLAVAFSGWVDADQALSDSAGTASTLTGSKYLAFGGGNSDGHWTSAHLSKIISYCSSHKFSAYVGLAFDIEEGDSGLASQFSKAFATCKSAGYKILVTVSHSAPYGFSDASSLMSSFISNKNIAYLSPQLYTSGTEGANDYTTAAGVTWSQYAKASAIVVPSIVSGPLYPSAQSYFAGQGVKTGGYVQWSQTVASAAIAEDAAVADTAVTAPVVQQTPSSGSDSTLSPLQIGLITGAVVVVVVAAVVIAVVLGKKSEERV